MFSEAKEEQIDYELVDSFEGRNYVIGCAVEVHLKHDHIWNFWKEFSQNKIVTNLDEIPIIKSILIQTMREDRDETSEYARKKEAKNE